jgi:hypothetical protein
LAAERLKTLHGSLDELATCATASKDDCARAAAKLCRWRRDRRGRGSRSRRIARTLAQQQAGAGADRAARARTHRDGSLKVKFNSIFGYYIEVSKPNLHLVPQDYERKQTLVGAERFTTPELKEYEAKILDAQEKIVEIERRLFTELRTRLPPRPSGSGRPRWRWLKWMCWLRWRTSRRCEIIAGRNSISIGRRLTLAIWKSSRAGIR